MFKVISYIFLIAVLCMFSVNSFAVPGKMNAPKVIASPTIGTALIVSWVAPANRGAGVRSYEIYYKLTSDADIFANWIDVAVNDATATTKTLEGLNENTSYDVKILALDIHGRGVSSEITTASTLTPAPPPKPRTYIEYRDEDGQIAEYNSMGKNPPFQYLSIRIERLERTPFGGLDVRDFVRPFGRDLRIKSENGDEIARVGSKFYMRMMLHSEFVRLGWDRHEDANQFSHERQGKHPFFWKLNGDPDNMRIWKEKAWGWVNKPTEAWFRISVNFDKCKCGIDSPADFPRNRTPGADGAVYFMVMQVKVQRPGKPHIIDNRIPFALSVGGINSPNAPSNSYKHKLATTWGSLKNQ